jgi:hypothetical protein
MTAICSLDTFYLGSSKAPAKSSRSRGMMSPRRICVGSVAGSERSPRQRSWTGCESWSGRRIARRVGRCAEYSPITARNSTR